MQEVIQMLPAHLKIGIIASIGSAVLIIAAGIFLLNYYKNFFIGENPKEWKLAAFGLILYGLFVPIDIATILILSEKYLFLLCLAQLVGPLVILFGFLKAFRSREGII